MQVGEQAVPTITAELLEREAEEKNPTTSLGHLSLPHLLLWSCSKPHSVPTASLNTIKHLCLPVGGQLKQRQTTSSARTFFKQWARCSSKGATTNCGKHLQGFAAREPTGAQSPPAKLLQHL